MPKAFYKHKLLLDEHLYHRRAYLMLNQRFDVKHIKEDLGLGGIDDVQLYELALKHGRIILTSNVKDFRPLLTDDSPGIVGVPQTWPAERLDSKLNALLTRYGPKHFRGRYIPLAVSEDS